jgi:hypothetical protein
MAIPPPCAERHIAEVWALARCSSAASRWPESLRASRVALHPFDFSFCSLKSSGASSILKLFRLGRQDTLPRV